MHEKILAGIGRDLGELRRRNPSAYRRLEKKLGAVSEEADVEVHKTLRRKKLKRVV